MFKHTVEVDTQSDCFRPLEAAFTLTTIFLESRLDKGIARIN